LAGAGRVPGRRGLRHRRRQSAESEDKARDRRQPIYPGVDRDQRWLRADPREAVDGRVPRWRCRAPQPCGGPSARAPQPAVRAALLRGDVAARAHLEGHQRTSQDTVVAIRAVCCGLVRIRSLRSLESPAVRLGTLGLVQCPTRSGPVAYGAPPCRERSIGSWTLRRSRRLRSSVKLRGRPYRRRGACRLVGSGAWRGRVGDA
jgi:hypothetical protein